MKEEAQALLAIASRLTAYPTDQFHDELREIKEYAMDQLQNKREQKKLLKMVDHLSSLPLREVREQYVAAFDLKERTGLYLTAHELGDSRKRGVALIELMQFIRSNGFEPHEGELPDYIPMLYELAAVTRSSHEEPIQLMDRLAYATHRIRTNLVDENPFKPIFDVLMEDTLQVPTEEKMKEMEQKRVRPDLETMPYPLMYN